MQIVKHPRFKEFFFDIKDKWTKAKLLAKISSLAAGNPGNNRHVGEGVQELKVDYGPGWRIYYVRVGEEVVMLLAGGTKNRQQQDIETAKTLARELKR